MLMMESIPGDYRSLRTGLSYHHSPLGGTMAECGPRSPDYITAHHRHQEELTKAAQAHNNNNNNCYTRPPSPSAPIITGANTGSSPPVSKVNIHYSYQLSGSHQLITITYIMTHSYITNHEANIRLLPYSHMPIILVEIFTHIV